MHTNHYGDNMTKKTRPTYSPEYKVECAQLVLDQGYSVIEASEAINLREPIASEIYAKYLRCIAVAFIDDDSKITYRPKYSY